MSGRYSGEVRLGPPPTQGALGPTDSYTFSLSAAGSAHLYVDDAVVKGSVTLAAGLHRVRIDYTPPASGSPQLSLQWTPGGVDLRPRYANVTKTVTDDDHGVPATVTTTNVEAATGLVKASTIDPHYSQNPKRRQPDHHGGLRDVADGKFHRPTFRTLPAGNAPDVNHATSTAYTYYAGVTHPGGQTVPAEKGEFNTCARDSTSVNQAGGFHVTTAPAPDANTALS